MDVVSSQRKMVASRRGSGDVDRPGQKAASLRASKNGKHTANKTGSGTGLGPLQRLRRSRSSSAPPRMGRRRHRLVEDHYRVDPEAKVLLPGLPAHDDDWARDTHDFFNLVVLIPVVVLNVMNWNWDALLDPDGNKTVAESWTGEWFDAFWHVTLAYFIVDLIWVSVVPSCVKSPSTIVQHHIATILYIMVPYLRARYQWCMGACMSVEVNTWFLIARRVFNKQGFPPWTISLPPFISIRVKLISIFFYLTWVSIRCVLYPALMVSLYGMWLDLSEEVGTKINIMAIVLPLHSIFCALNFKWTFDLFMSKMRNWKRGTPSKADKGL